MYDSNKKKQILEVLEDLPFIKYAARKVGIDKATIHRWMKNDLAFKELVGRRIERGRMGLIEDAEFGIVKKIRVEESLAAMKFYLQHNSKQYFPRQPMYVFPLEKDQYQPSPEEEIFIEYLAEKISKNPRFTLKE